MGGKNPSPKNTKPVVVAVEKLDASYRLSTRSPILGVESSLATSSGDLRERSSESENKNTIIRKRGRQPGSRRSGSPQKGTIPAVSQRWETSQDDEIWARTERSGVSESVKKRRKLSGFEIVKLFTAAQRKVLEEKLTHLEVMSSVQLAEEAIGYVSRAEEARRKSPNIKGDLNNHIKEDLFIARNAIQKLAIRAAERGDVIPYKERCKALQVEVDELKNKLKGISESVCREDMKSMGVRPFANIDPRYEAQEIDLLQEEGSYSLLIDREKFH